MRKRLFAFFMVILFFGISITGFVYYNFMKSWIMDNTKDSLKSETALVEEYTKYDHANINLDTLAKDLSKVIKRRITIINSKGVVVGESDLSKDKLENHFYRPEIQMALKTGEGYAIRVSDTEKIPFYYYAKKTTIDNKTFFIRIAIKLNAINDIQKQYLKFIIFATFLGIVIVVTLSIIYLNNFMKPIKSLIDMTSDMSMGDYEKKVHINSNDEIGQLGNAFNLLSDRLQLTINDLADKQNKLYSILTSMHDGVIVIDRSKRIMLINPAAKNFLNIDYDVTGSYFIEAIRNYDFEDIIKNVPKEEVEITIKYPVLRKLRIRITKVANYDEKNDQSMHLIVIQDITKIKALEQMRSDFVANVSHELKTPLTSIRGFAETLKYVEDAETKDKFLDIINVEAERLTRLINDILTLSEIENKDYSINMERINIKASIQDVVYIMEPVARNKSINLVFEPDELENDLYINGDNDKFKQMIINLVDNGIKYTNNEGKVNIKIVKAENEAKIIIQDNGIGISKEHISRLFERFYRVDKARSRSIGGTGLGLAIVKHISILLNGRIEIASEVGKGTSFTIYLPLI